MHLHHPLINQRAVAVILAAVAIATFYMSALHWWFASPLWQIEEEMEDLREIQRRHVSLNAQRLPLEARLFQVQQQAGAEGALDGPDSGAATAQLMQLVSQEMESSPREHDGCTVINRIPIPPHDVDGFMQVKISLELECGMEALGMLIHRLENGTPFLFIDSLGIRQGGSQKAGNLLIQMSVSGYVSIQDSKAALP